MERLRREIEQSRDESDRLRDENARLTRDIDALKARVNAAEGASGELATLREERDLIRSRVDEMLTQIESLNR